MDGVEVVGEAMRANVGRGAVADDAEIVADLADVGRLQGEGLERRHDDADPADLAHAHVGHGQLDQADEADQRGKAHDRELLLSGRNSTFPQ